MTERLWTRERVIETIQELHRGGVPVGKIWSADRKLCAVSYSVFDSWRDALAAAGLKSVRERWSKERVLDELRKRYPRGFTRYRLGKENTRLTSAANRYFGSLHEALVAAGICRGKRRENRSWTSEQVIASIQQRHQRGLSLSQVWRIDKPLYATAKRKFGSWRQAVQAAGFEFKTTRVWTAWDILQAIQDRRKQGLSLVGIWKSDPPFFSAAKRHFGNWSKALAAAGMSIKTVRRWTKSSVVAAIRQRHEQGQPLSRTWHDDQSLFSAAVRHFGNWHNALRAAGLDAEALPYQKWTRERVLDAMRARRREGHANIRAVDPALAGAASRLFGSWDRALEEAELAPPPRRWTKRRVIEAIQDARVRCGPLRIAGAGDKRLAAAAKRHFGSWPAAVAAAGLAEHCPPPATTRTWTKQAVLDAIQAWHRDGRTLTNVNKQDQGLYSVAKKYFGTWRSAVRAAGLEPTRQAWTPQLVIQEIQSRQDRGLTLNSAVFKDCAPLAGAAVRLFGSWRYALTAAGIDPDLVLLLPSKKGTHVA